MCPAYIAFYLPPWIYSISTRVTFLLYFCGQDVYRSLHLIAINTNKHPVTIFFLLFIIILFMHRHLDSFQEEAISETGREIYSTHLYCVFYSLSLAIYIFFSLLETMIRSLLTAPYSQIKSSNAHTILSLIPSHLFFSHICYT